MFTISSLRARQVIDSRGNPTVEAEITVNDKFFGRATVPSGASTGDHEALELRDGNEHEFFGKGVTRAVEHINTVISAQVIGKAYDQRALDDHLNFLDGTINKSHLGANAILAVSLAFAWAASKAEGKALYEYISEIYGNSQVRLPMPWFNIMNGGKHADWATDIQEYVVIPEGFSTWGERLRAGVEIYQTLRNLLKEKGLSIQVGDEGGFAPLLSSNQAALDLIVQAVEKSGYQLGEQIKLGLDVAASEFYSENEQKYLLKRDQQSLTGDEMIEWAKSLCTQYPIHVLEDFLSQDDWDHWSKLTKVLGSSTMIVGDDLLVTNVERITKAIESKACNALLVKVNQIGTLSQTLDAMKKAHDAGWQCIVSHRSGETEDVTIAHLAVGTGCGWIKTGATARGERTAKYNELSRIAEKVE